MNRTMNNNSLIDIDEDVDHLTTCPYKSIICVSCSISCVCLIYLLFFLHLVNETVNNSNSTDYD